MARAATLYENLLLYEANKVRIYEGYSSDFLSQTGVTVIDGSLTIGRGELTVEELVII
jgi:hypothetical protein